MRASRSALAVACAMAFTVAAVGVVAAAPLQAATDGPHITIDRNEVNPGDPILVSMTGFKAFSVTVSMCGNLAKRGSTDCAMATSQGEQIDQYDRVTYTQLIVQPPPAPCPCLIRAVSTYGDEFAVAPITLIGHPVAPVVGVTSGPLLSVQVHAKRVSDGMLDSLRTALGGKTKYAVTVSVRNLTTETLSNVSLVGAAGNTLSDDAAKLALPPPGPLDAGQTWTDTVPVELPSPVVGQFSWTVTAYGAGQSVTSVEGMSTMPFLLYLLVLVFVVDVAWLARRFVERRRARRADLPVEGLVDISELVDGPAVAQR